MEKTDNEIIETFWIEHGGKPHMKEDIWFYESSWDMLMPVVEKINRMSPNEFTDEDSQDIFRFVRWPSVTKLKINTSLQDLYKAVVEFIKWYNTQPKQNGN